MNYNVSKCLQNNINEIMTTTSVPFSMRIDSKLKQEFDEIAKSDNCSSSALATELIEKYLETRQKKKLAISNAVAEADGWDFVSHESMKAWFASLGWTNEKTFPEVDVFTNHK